ncbi:DUF6332 family protein [Streptomyces longwoodensis]|uniref:DUF6332 family protein n=1 Tax=Streptomyces longwoodensis TaxID=68231 RepID=UPI0033EDE5CF
MTEHQGRRTQADRDAITVEIGYALVSAAFATAVVVGAVAGPALLFDLPALAERSLKGAAVVIAPVLFLTRVVTVLVRFRRGAQPSQPGRTNPDS